jgi:Lrp/AsnC family leucine-responsive transcriptional regulator
MSLDRTDRLALERLMRDGRVTWAELAKALRLSAAAAAQRVRRLERAGTIRGYAALVDAVAVGQPLAAFLGVTLTSHRERGRFLKRIAALPGVLECHHVTGEFDYLLKVRCAGTAELERLVNDQLKSHGGVASSRTLVVLSTAKESPRVPVSGTDA